MHKRRQVDQVHIDEVDRVRQRRECCLQQAGLTDSQTLLGQPEGCTQAAVEQPSGLVAQRPVGLTAGRVDEEHVDVTFRDATQSKIDPRRQMVAMRVAGRAERGN
jgi:hypothetical protein